MSDFWNQISPSEGAVPLSVVASRSQDVVASVVKKASVSRADAETIQGRVEKRYGAGDGTDWEGPKLLEDWDWVAGEPAPYSLVWEEGPDDWAFEDWDAGLNVYVEPITSWALGIYPSGKTGSLKTAETDYDQIDFDANRAYWSGQARAAEEAKASEMRLRAWKGQEVTVIKGRKIPIGTTGTVFYSGEGQWGWRIGFTTPGGEEMWTSLQNVELTSELSSTASVPVGTQVTQVIRFLDQTPDGKYDLSGRAVVDCPYCDIQIEASGYMNAASNALNKHISIEHGLSVPLLPPSTAAGRRCQFCNKSITFGGMQWQDTTTGTDCPMSNVGHSPSPREDIVAPPQQMLTPESYWGSGAPFVTATRKTAGPMGINVGDIFYNSWGYDQTNVDFYEVVRTTEKMVEIKPIQSRVVEGGAYSQSVEPVRGSYRDYDVIIDTGRSSPYGQPERQTKMCRVRDGYNGGPTVVLSDSHSAYPYKGGSLSESGPYGGH